MLRRTLLGSALATPALAQADFPRQSIRLVVPFAPGGSTDVIARIIAPGMGEALGKPVIIENRPGAGGTVASEMLVNATPDGHTIVQSSFV